MDEVWQVVDKRTSVSEYSVINKMRQFGERIVNCGEGGVSNEIVRKRRSFGGFTANTGSAVSRLGVETTMIGLFGKDRMDPVFEPLGQSGKTISVGNPAVTMIYEFGDGKVMLPYTSEIAGFCWDILINEIEPDTLRQIFGDCDIVAAGYWTLVPSFNDLVDKYVNKLIKGGRTKRMFFDFADTKKRDKKSLDETLAILCNLQSESGLKMTLSLNEHEAEDVFTHYGFEFKMEPGVISGEIEKARRRTGLDELIVHTPHFAVLAESGGEITCVNQNFVENPVRTTGAGDTFNGGYIAASLKNLSPAERLAVANLTTELFVLNGESPDSKTLVEELGSRIARGFVF